MSSFTQSDKKKTGDLVRLPDGRKGIVYHSDQKKSFKGKTIKNEKLKKVLVTMVSDTYEELDEPKRLVKQGQLKHIGFVD